MLDIHLLSFGAKRAPAVSSKHASDDNGTRNYSIAKSNFFLSLTNTRHLSVTFEAHFSLSIGGRHVVVHPNSAMPT